MPTASTARRPLGRRALADGGFQHRVVSRWRSAAPGVTRPRSRATTTPGDGWWTWATPTGIARPTCAMSPADLESIAHHEIGHALIFNPVERAFGAAKLFGRLRDDRLRAYLGSDPKIDRSDHLPGTIDPASLHGAFGNEYHGKTPYGRWQITRTDLLCAGHRLPAARDLGLRPRVPDDRGAPRRIDLGPLLGEADRHRRHPVLSLGGHRRLPARRPGARPLHGRAAGHSQARRGFPSSPCASATMM